VRLVTVTVKCREPRPPRLPARRRAPASRHVERSRHEQRAAHFTGCVDPIAVHHFAGQCQRLPGIVTRTVICTGGGSNGQSPPCGGTPLQSYRRDQRPSREIRLRPWRIGCHRTAKRRVATVAVGTGELTDPALDFPSRRRPQLDPLELTLRPRLSHARLHLHALTRNHDAVVGEASITTARGGGRPPGASTAARNRVAELAQARPSSGTIASGRVE